MLTEAGLIREHLPTTSDAELYRIILFPDFSSVDELVTHLCGKVVIDLGGGLTHRDPESLITLVTARNAPGTIFLNVDINADKQLYTVPIPYLRSGEATSHKAIPAVRSIRKGDLLSQGPLPLPKHCADYVISNYLFGYLNQLELEEALRRVAELLKQGGEARIMFGSFDENMMEVGAYNAGLEIMRHSKIPDNRQNIQGMLYVLKKKKRKN